MGKKHTGEEYIVNDPGELLENLIGRMGFDGLLFRVSKILEGFAAEGVDEPSKFLKASKTVKRCATCLRDLRLLDSQESSPLFQAGWPPSR